METNTLLPVVDVRRRFGSITIGYEHVDKIRTEHSVLTQFVARVLKTTPEQLTVAQVSAALNDLPAPEPVEVHE